MIAINTRERRARQRNRQHEEEKAGIMERKWSGSEREITGVQEVIAGKQ